MTECAGSCATVAQCRIVSDRKPMDDWKDAYDKRRIARQEIRKQELEQKGNANGLSTSEAMELAGYKIQSGLEKLAKLHADSICYMA